MASNMAVVSKSWSRSPYDLVQIEHIWTIDKFSLRKEEQLFSSVFSSSQDESSENVTKWRMRLHPIGKEDEDEEGNDTNNKDYLSLFVSLLNPPEDTILYVNYSFNIQDEKGNCLKFYKEENCDFSGDDCACWGEEDMCKRDAILGKLPNDILQIKCELNYLSGLGNVSGIGTTQEPRALEVACCSCDFSKLSDSYEVLLTDHQFSDVTIICLGSGEKTEFRVHKAILAARCPYFEAMFKNEMKEKRENLVQIEGVKPEIFKEILSYIYTGKTQKNMTENAAKEVLVGADRFALLELKSVAENELVSKFTIENASDLLVLGDTHSADILKTKAMEYVASNLNEVLQTPGWDVMNQQHPHLSKEAISIMISKAFA